MDQSLSVSLFLINRLLIMARGGCLDKMARTRASAAAEAAGDGVFAMSLLFFGEVFLF